MQKILIGDNIELNCICSPFINILVELFGYDYKYWENAISEDSILNSIRTNEILQQYFTERNMILYSGMVRYICDSDDTKVDYKVKIIEIPDDVKWHIREFEGDVGEYVVEDHRTWI